MSRYIDAERTMTDDLISRADAIEAVWKPQVKPNELIFDALKTAIESEINNVPSADRPQGDVDAVAILMREMHNLDQGYITIGEFDERIEPLRHLCYGRPQGEWEYHSNPALGINPEDAFCPYCKYHIDTTMVDFDDYNFCPNCGARMRETHDIHTNTHECVKKPKAKKPCTNCEYHDWIWDEHFGYGSVCNGIGRCPYNVEETITSDQTERSE